MQKFHFYCGGSICTMYLSIVINEYAIVLIKKNQYLYNVCKVRKSVVYYYLLSVRDLKIIHF